MSSSLVVCVVCVFNCLVPFFTSHILCVSALLVCLSSSFFLFLCLCEKVAFGLVCMPACFFYEAKQSPLAGIAKINTFGMVDSVRLCQTGTCHFNFPCFLFLTPWVHLYLLYSIILPYFAILLFHSYVLHTG